MIKHHVTGVLRSCLLDGDPTELRPAQKVRRRAMALSISVQSIAVASLILLPLFGKGERIPIRIVTELPSYRHRTDPPHPGGVIRHAPGSTQPCFFCKPASVRAKPAVETARATDPPQDEPGGIGADPPGIPGEILNSIEIPQHEPRRPPRSETTETLRLRIGHIDPSHLIHRIEPIYPKLGVQLRRETRVELHAIISIDGSIQSLEILSGDSLFYPSAIEAVRRWQYTPSILNRSSSLNYAF